jgi:hypothetical protein
MNIDWGASLASWTPSGKAQEVNDSQRIDLLISFLEAYGAQELLDIEVSHRRWQETFYSLQECNLNENALALEAASQLKVHRKVWETHLDESVNLAFEFPVAVKIDNVLFYFKTIIYIDIEFKEENFEKIRKLEISFHRNKNATRIHK